MKANASFSNWLNYSINGGNINLSLEVFGFFTKMYNRSYRSNVARKIESQYITVNSFSMSITPDGDFFGGGVIPSALSCDIELGETSIDNLFDDNVKKSGWRYTYGSNYVACIPIWSTTDGSVNEVRGPIMWLVDMQKDALSNRLHLQFYDQLYELNFIRTTAQYGVTSYTYRELVKRFLSLPLWSSEAHNTKGSDWNYGTLEGIENIPDIACDDFSYRSGHPLPSEFSNLSERESLGYILQAFGCYLFQSDQDTFRIGKITEAPNYASITYNYIKDGAYNTLEETWKDVEVISNGGLGTKKNDHGIRIYSVSGNPYVRDNNYTAIQTCLDEYITGKDIYSGDFDGIYNPVIEPGDEFVYWLKDANGTIINKFLKPITSIQWDGQTFAKYKQSEPKEIDNKYW